MGGERWLMFSSKKQADEARAFLAPMRLPEHKDEDYGYISMGDENGDCWLSWTSACKLELGYSFGGHEANSTAAEITARELAKRFKCRKLGSDSTGWYPNSDWESDHEHGAKARYGPHDNWIEWLKKWTPEWSFTVMMLVLKDIDAGWLADLREQLGKVDAKITARFAELDQGK